MLRLQSFQNTVIELVLIRHPCHVAVIILFSFYQLQLQQQMQRHADAMEQARLQSEGTIENLRKKLNTLQDVSK